MLEAAFPDSAPLRVDRACSHMHCQVGTVFQDGSLAEFYSETSFLPFGAVADGRQRLDDVAREVSFPTFAAGLVVGGAIECATLAWWVGVPVPPVQ